VVEERENSKMNKTLPTLIVSSIAVLIVLVLGFSLKGGKLGGSSGLSKGSYVGVATTDGTVFIGKLVLADKESVVLRDVFKSQGTVGLLEAPGAAGGEAAAAKPQIRVVPYQDALLGTEGGANTLVIERSKVIFMSSELAGFALDAVKNFKPTPSPEPIEPDTAPPAAPLDEELEPGETPEATPEDVPAGELEPGESPGLPSPTGNDVAPTPIASPKL